MASATDKGTRLGGGGLALGGAKLWFLIASYATTVSLTHLLDADVYGRYYVIARLIAVPNMVIIYTLLFAVSRPLAAEFEDGFPSYAALRRRGVVLAASLGGLTSLVLLVGAPGLAAALNDESLTTPIRVVAPISLLYALYAVNLGTLNAVRRFRVQASLDVFMATSKASLIIAAAAIGLGLSATVGGFTAAALLALLLSAALVVVAQPPRAGQERRTVSMASFAGVLVFFTALVNLLQSADVLLLKGFAQTSEQADAVGYYASAQQVALVPYSLMNAVALLMFPLIATVHARGEAEQVTRYVTQTAKVCVLLLAFASAVGSACAADIQSLLFPRAYSEAADELRLMVWGFSGYSFAVTTAWIFNSTKRTRWALTLVAVPLMILVLAATASIPAQFTSAAAMSVAMAGAAGTALALVALRRSFDVNLPVTHIAKIVFAVVAVEAAASLWPDPSGGAIGKLFTVAKLTTLSVVFLGVVSVTRAVRIDELRRLLRAR